MAQNTEHNSSYDKTDVNIKKAVIIGLSIVCFVVISLIVVNELFLSYEEELVYEMVLSPE